MEDDGFGKVKFKRRQDQKKPYDRNQSLLGRVGSTMKDMLKPSWLVDLVSSVKKRTPPQTPEVSTSYQPPDSFMSYPNQNNRGAMMAQQHQLQPNQVVPGMPSQAPASYMELPSQDPPETSPSLSSLSKSIEQTPHVPEMNFRSFKPSNSMHNGDNDGSELTEYCMPNPGTPVIRPLHNDFHQKDVHHDLNPVSTPSESHQISKMPHRLDNNFNEQCCLQVNGLGSQASEQDLIEGSFQLFKPLLPISIQLTGPGSADADFSCAEEAQKAFNRIKTSHGKKGLTVTFKQSSQEKGNQSESTSFLWSAEKPQPRPEKREPQPPAKRHKPCFNSSSFLASSQLNENHDASLSRSFNSSPFYPGKTTFGGASAHRRPQFSRGMSSQTPTPKQQVSAKPLASTSFSSGVTSSTAKRILDTLDKMSTPLSDAKKIPNYSSPLADSPLPFTPSSYRRSSLSNKKASRGPPTHGTPSASRARIVSNLRPPASNLTKSLDFAASQKEEQSFSLTSAVAASSSSAAASSTGRSGKMKHDRGSHYSKRKAPEEVEDEAEIPQLSTDFILPVVNLPPINLGTPVAPSSKPKETTIVISSSRKDPPPPVGQFQFSSPLSAETREKDVTGSKCSVSGNFQFSSPISLNKEAPAKPNANSSNFSFKPKEVPMTKEIPKANVATPKLSFGSSSPVPSPAGAVKVASTLKKGSVMDILGKSPANGGITVAAELKTGSVMDILGGKKSTENISKPDLSSMFKKPSGSWECPTCMIVSQEDISQCPACETKKPSAALSAAAPAPQVPSTLSSAFKKPEGNWDCPTCWINNKADQDKCVACETKNPNNAPKVPVVDVPRVPDTLSSTFKKPEGSWDCPTCWISNKGDQEKCVACETKNPNSAPKVAVETPVVNTSSLGSTLKKAPGAWDCPTCWVNNKADQVKCPACETPNPNAPVPEMKPSLSETWECDTCLVPNSGSATKCIACEALKPGMKRTSSFISEGGFKMAAAGGLTFGTPKETTEDAPSTGGFKLGSAPDPAKDVPKTGSGFKFGSTSEATKDATPSAGGFKFGAATDPPKDVASAGNGFKFGSTSEATKDATPSAGGFKFGAATDPPKDVASAGNGFKFGSTSEANKDAVGGFKFGSTATSANDSKKESGESGFKFGAPDIKPEKSDSSAIKFGIPTASDAKMNDGGFSFGIPSSLDAAKTNTSDVKFGATENLKEDEGIKFSVPVVNDTKKDSGFKFGVPADSSKQGITFGAAPAADPASDASAAPFKFGGPTTRAAEPVPTDSNKASGLVFGASHQTSSEAIPPPAYNKVTTSKAEAQPASSLFKFGAAASKDSNVNSALNMGFGHQPAETEKPGFQFGKVEVKEPTAATASPFQFGAQSAVPKSSASGMFAPMAAADKPAESFAFGGATKANDTPASTSSSLFKFGASNSISTNAKPLGATDAASKSSFAFGAMSSTPAATGGFNFGGSSATAAPASSSSDLFVFGSSKPATGGLTRKRTDESEDGVSAAKKGGSAMNAASIFGQSAPPAFSSPSGGFSALSSASSLGSTAAPAANAFGSASMTASFTATPAAPNIFAPKQDTEPPKSFAFGGTPAAGNSAPFKFGATASAPVANASAPFAFGQQAAPAAPPSFNFGAASNTTFSAGSPAPPAQQSQQPAAPFQMNADNPFSAINSNPQRQRVIKRATRRLKKPQ